MSHDVSNPIVAQLSKLAGSVGNQDQILGGKEDDIVVLTHRWLIFQGVRKMGLVWNKTLYPIIIGQLAG